MSIVKANGLKKYYGREPNIVRALDGVDVTVNEGEFVAITGMSGSGKSTLMYLLGGLETPTDGTIEIDGLDLLAMERETLTIFRRHKVGFIFQNYNLVPILDVYENIVLPIELGGGAIDEPYIDGIVDALGIADKKTVMPNMLSGGQQQRVAIARALATKPAIILADEPTGNLDSKTGHDVMELLKTMGKQYKQTIILVTHNDVVANMADRIIHLEDGKVIRDTKVKA